MRWGLPNWRSWVGWLGAACALVIVAEWAWHLTRSIPPVARSDHLKSMWRAAPAIEHGDWPAVLGWIFEFTGGHVIAYARAIQLANYLFFDYSGAFIKAAAIVSFVATWAAVALALVRTSRWGLQSAILLSWSAWLICSPVLANLVTWPEGAPPFLAPTLVIALLVPWLATGSRRAVAAGTVAMAFTNGSGFVFLPAALAAHMRRSLVVLMMGVLAALLGAVLLALWALRRQGIQPSFSLPYSTVDLGMAVKSLYAFAAHPGFFAKYCLALLALPFAPFRVVDTWAYGLVVAGYMAVVIALSDHRRPGPQRAWLVVAYFGLFASVVVALARYGYVDPDRPQDAVISSHYAAVVLPLYLAVGALTPLVLQGRRRGLQVALAACAAVLLAMMVQQRSRVERDFSYSLGQEMAIQFGARNWNIYAAAASLGDTGVGQIALMRFYPELKAWGKYPELTRELVVDPSSTGVDRAAKDMEASCGGLHAFGPDTRYPWATPVPGAHLHSPKVVEFTRAVGYVDCAAEFVVMADEKGVAQCMARPGPLATYFTEPELKARPGMGERSFDFSCPGGHAASVWAFDRSRGVLVPIRAGY